MQNPIWASDLKMSQNWMKLKALRCITYKLQKKKKKKKKNILDFLLDKKRKGNKHYNFVVHKFVLDYLESLNVKSKFKIWELTILKNTHSLPRRKNKPKI